MSACRSTLLPDRLGRLVFGGRFVSLCGATSAFGRLVRVFRGSGGSASGFDLADGGALSSTCAVLLAFNFQ